LNFTKAFTGAEQVQPGIDADHRGSQGLSQDG
jgi:hypothetical protein